MKTIEERAREEAPLFPYGFDEYEANYRREEFMDGYIQGATEQRAIDMQRAIDIEKACEWLMERYVEDDIDMMSASAFINDFRKAMEE